jgi:hypothetical protein
MIQRATNNLDAKILEAMVAPEQASLAPALAKALLSCEFQPAQQAEIEKLLTRNNAGTITAGQRHKLEAYIRVGNLISLLKAKARASLAGKMSRQ